MKAFKKICIAVLLACSFVLPTLSLKAETKEASAATTWVGTKTGYTKASDVKYVTSGGYVANWGARDEDCVFLSKYATAFYTGNYTYNVLSQKKGSSTESSVPSSALYTSLQSLMSSKQDYETSYNATKSLFRYTDCVNSNTSYISSFYSGTRISGSWDGSWNREHTWPNSKGDKAGNGENDIMMLRPTSTSENGARGNMAYGESSGYYNPNGEGQSLKGDCARIVLYVYVRWKCTNTGSNYNPNGITGKNGLIENINMLLEWIEEDPVDTWEMGRNDAVQSITGTRNVFVDYPEYAFLLFGRAVPSNMTTPSSGASENTTSSSSKESSSVENSSKPTSSADSSKEDIDDSSNELNSSMGGSNEDSEVDSEAPDSSFGSASDESGCAHTYGEWIVLQEPTETEDGERWRLCSTCHEWLKEKIPSTGGNASEDTSEATSDLAGESNSEVDSEKASESTDDLMFMSGCVASVGTSAGGVLLMLTACAFIRKAREKEE
ncbi:MAG: endonuclease [Clostridia bacterium]|nr:endonuclease [Clostridia bacterium]